MQRISLTVNDYKEKTDHAIRIIEKRIDKLSENFISESDVKDILIYKGQKFEADKAYIDIYRKA